MTASLTRYIRAGGMTLFAKIFAAFAAFAEIYFLNHLLGKEGYGAFFYAMTVVMMVGIIIGNPMRSLVLYKLSGTDSSLMQTRFFRSVTGYTILIGVFAASLLSFTGWETWIIALAFLTLCEMTRVTLCAGLQAAQNIPAMTFYNTLLPYALRITVLAGLVVFGLNTVSAITIAYSIAFILPVLILIVRFNIRPSLDPAPWSKADIAYGLKTILTQIIHQNARYLDVIIIGSLGFMAATADYAVALKFGSLLLLGKHMIQGLITPRLKTDDGLREFAAARFFETGIVYGGIIVFTLFGGMILPLFGDYEAVETLFFLVAAATLPKVMTGCAAEFLYMKGHAGWVLVTTILTLVISLIAGWILIPLYGATGSALTALTGSIMAAVTLAIGCYKTDQFNVTANADFILGILSMLTCLATGFGILSVSACAFITLGILGVYAWAYRDLLHHAYTALKTA